MVNNLVNLLLPYLLSLAIVIITILINIIVIIFLIYQSTAKQEEHFLVTGIDICPREGTL